MASSPTFVIIGGGLAGAKAAEALRSKHFGGQVVLFGAEDRLPYERPPLSKEFMAGKKTIEEFSVRPQSWYTEHDIDLRLGTEVTTLDRTAHMVAFNDGDHEHYDKLVLATGSRARKPPIPGADAQGVHFLRTVDDAALCAVVTKAGYEAAPHVDGAKSGPDTDDDHARDLLRRLLVAAVIWYIFWKHGFKYLKHPKHIDDTFISPTDSK